MLTYHCLAFKDLSIEQLYDIIYLRQVVFIVEQNCIYLDADGKDRQGYHVLGVDEEGVLQAYARILGAGISYDQYPSIGRVANAMTIRGQGEGKRLMEFSLAACKDLFGDQPIKISAQTYLKKFYFELGFQATGEEYLEDGIPHMGMIYKAH